MSDEEDSNFDEQEKAIEEAMNILEEAGIDRYVIAGFQNDMVHETIFSVIGPEEGEVMPRDYATLQGILSQVDNKIIHWMYDMEEYSHNKQEVESDNDE